MRSCAPLAPCGRSRSGAIPVPSARRHVRERDATDGEHRKAAWVLRLLRRGHHCTLHGVRLIASRAMSDLLQFDAATLRRYDRPGPRYTSYPTAPQFGRQFDRGDASRAHPGAATPSRFRAGCRCTCTSRTASARASTAVAIASSRATCARAHLLERLQREIEHDRAAVRSRPRSRPGASRRRHAELSRAGADARRSCDSLRRHFHSAERSASAISRSSSIRASCRPVTSRELCAARLQPRQPRRAGFRSGGAARGEPHPERRGNAARSSTHAAPTASARSTST